VRSVSASPSPFNHIIVEQFGGAMARVSNDSTAFDQRGARYNLLILALSTDPAADAAQAEWARGVWQAAQPYSTGGAYLNYLGTDENAHSAYGSSKFERLAALKSKYDPSNLFCLNMNVRPSG